MRKHYLKLLAPSLLAVSLTACGQSDSENATAEVEQKATEAVEKVEEVAKEVADKTEQAAEDMVDAVADKVASDVTFENDEQRQSYAIATTVGTQLKQQFDAQDAPIDFDMFKKGLNDILNDKTPALNEEEVEQALTAFEERMVAEQQERVEKAKEEGEAYLAENKAKEGVTETQSGLQYEVLESGDAAGQTPSATDVVKVHYVGTLIDGTEFDSSYSRNQPAEFPLNGVIPGWTEALQLMRPGDKWKVTIPSDLAYGEAGAGRTIPPNSTLIFDIELLEIVDSGIDEQAPEAPAAPEASE